VPHFNALAGVIPCQYRHKWYVAKNWFFGLHFRWKKYWCIFNHLYVIRPESYRIRRNYAAVRTITPMCFASVFRSQILQVKKYIRFLLSAIAIAHLWTEWFDVDLARLSLTGWTRALPYLHNSRKHGLDRTAAGGCVMLSVPIVGGRCGEAVGDSASLIATGNIGRLEEWSVQIFIPYERTFIPVFWEEEWLVGGRPLLGEILGQPTPLERNRRFSTNNRSQLLSRNT